MIGSMGTDGNPGNGILSIPIMGCKVVQTFAMTTRDILAENFNKLRNACPRLYSLKDITKSGGGSNGTLGRISAKQSGASIDTVEALARVYGLEAWQLLVPSLDAKKGPGDTVVISGLPDWPFPNVDRDRYEKLSEASKGSVQARMRDAIKEEEEIASSHRANGTHGK